MRALILVAGSALLLAACGSKDQSANVANTDENLSAESISANDVTAIDAVTGDASNMAADVNYTEPPIVENNGEATHMPTPRTRAPGKPPLETPTPTNQESTTNAE